MFESMWNRRQFLKALGTTAATASVSSKGFGENVSAVSIVVDPADETAGSKPVKWALEHLAEALKARGASVSQVGKSRGASDGNLWIMVADAKSSAAQRVLRDAKASVADAPEALGLVAVSSEGKQGLARMWPRFAWAGLRIDRVSGPGAKLSRPDCSSRSGKNNGGATGERSAEHDPAVLQQC